ncbi:MAG: transcriptional regulator [Treponema sp.]|nr:transcriptional regulator [Treponema sp.]
MSHKLIISIVPRDAGDGIVKAANEAGASGGTILLGTGTASSNLLSLLGFGNKAKDLVFILVAKEIEAKVIQSISDYSLGHKSPFGVLWSLDVSRLIKCGEENGGKDKMADKATHQMITVILNKGYAEDAMAAARKAGAGGGTVLNARGTAKEGDAKFFGVEIVPEKDMLLILVPAEKADAVVDAIKNLPSLQKPGSGITFCSDAQNFTLLGSK